jgi:hypothetical protein
MCFCFHFVSTGNDSSKQKVFIVLIPILLLCNIKVGLPANTQKSVNEGANPNYKV